MNMSVKTSAAKGLGSMIGGSGVLLLAGLMVAAVDLRGALRVPSVFTDHMVLQREQANPVWGWDDPGTKVRVRFGETEVRTVADAAGRWEVELEARPAQWEPETLLIEGTDRLEIEDVLVGEVWICSGQSNMQWALRQTWNGDLNALGADYPGMRLLTVPRVGTQELQDDFEGEWVLAGPETVLDFSAIGYYFGRFLHETLDVPVGLIDNAWGGSAAEAWIHREALEGEGRFRRIVETAAEKEAQMQTPEARETHEVALEEWEAAKAAAEAEGRRVPRKPRSPEAWLSGNQRAGNIYGGVLHPTIGYGIRGVIWYQGESNAPRARAYRDLFPYLIEHWRSEWGQGEFPFYWVQLADFREEADVPGESAWAELREAQTRTLSLPNTGQAVIIDLGEGNDIHPRNKHDVAARLARWALARDYGYDLTYRSPEFAAGRVSDSRVEIDFNCFGSRLRTVDSNTVKGFAICGEDREWHWAKARLVDGDTVEVWHEAIAEPVAVRYAWADNPDCNLISEEGLPVTPFRTDTFPMITEPES